MLRVWITFWSNEIAPSPPELLPIYYSAKSKEHWTPSKIVFITFVKKGSSGSVGPPRCFCIPPLPFSPPTHTNTTLLLFVGYRCRCSFQTSAQLQGMDGIDRCSLNAQAKFRFISYFCLMSMCVWLPVVVVRSLAGLHAQLESCRHSNCTIWHWKYCYCGFNLRNLGIAR